MSIEESVQMPICFSPANPSAPDLIDSFARAYDPEPAYVTFDLGTQGTIRAKITQLQYESGQLGMFIYVGISWNEKSRVRGFYNATKRTGSIMFVS